MSKELLYLACPYTHPNSCNTERRRRNAARKAERELREAGFHVYNPLGASEDYDHLGNDYWYAHGVSMLKRCDVLVVLKVDGWYESKGVRLEIDTAVSEKPYMPIVYAEPSNVVGVVKAYGIE